MALTPIFSGRGTGGGGNGAGFLCPPGRSRFTGANFDRLGGRGIVLLERVDVPARERGELPHIEVGEPQRTRKDIGSDCDRDA